VSFPNHHPSFPLLPPSPPPTSPTSCLLLSLSPAPVPFPTTSHARQAVKREHRKQVARFQKLRNFADVGARRRAEAEVRREKEKAAKEAKEKEEEDAREADRRRTLLTFLDVSIPADVSDKPIEEYAEGYFNLNRKGILGKRTTVTKILSWKNDVIKTSLRKMPTKDLGKHATQCFR
jgi:hypothetical protein